MRKDFKDAEQLLDAETRPAKRKSPSVHACDVRISLWAGPGWYAPRQHGDTVVLHLIDVQDHGDLDETARRVGMGTPQWVDDPAQVEVNKGDVADA
jgi:hypothetical protein